MAKTVLCYGDSNTYGYIPGLGGRYTKEQRWTGLLSKMLGPDYTVIEEGCNGRTTVFDDPDEEWKNGKTTLKACLNSHKPIDILIIMLGSNDLKEVFHVSARQIADGAGHLADMAREWAEQKQSLNDFKIILAAPAPVGEDIAKDPAFSQSALTRSLQFAELYKEVADQKNCIFFDAGSYAQSSKEDSLHLTPKGHRALAENFCKLIRSLDER